MNPADPTALPSLAVATVRGEDTMAFLNGQLSSDVTRLAPGEAGFGCVCDIKGRVLGLVLVCRHDEGVDLVASSSLMPVLLTHLQRFVLRARVSFEAQPDWAVVGHHAAPADAGVYAAAGLYYGIETETGDRPVDPFWAGHELQNGITWLSPESSGEFLPQMLGLEHIGAVHFDKGCYPGQEVIARVHWRGQVKRLPERLLFAEGAPPPPMSPVSLVQQAATASGVWVQDAPLSEQQRVALVVARGLSEGPIDAVQWEGQSLQVQRSATM